jgi:hypothetical protein
MMAEKRPPSSGELERRAMRERETSRVRGLSRKPRVKLKAGERCDCETKGLVTWLLISRAGTRRACATCAEAAPLGTLIRPIERGNDST